jgi:hypothetical protein
MNNYFHKINLNLGTVDIDRLKGDFFEGYGPTFNSFYIKDKNYFNNLLQDRIQFKIKPDWINYTEITDYGADPHTDHCATVLNYYIEANDFTTIFWNLKKEVDNIPMFQKRQDGQLVKNRTSRFNMSDVSPCTSFKAKSNEAYLLNSYQIHSTNRLLRGQPRTMLRWLWENDEFDTVKDSINILQ